MDIKKESNKQTMCSGYGLIGYSHFSLKYPDCTKYIKYNDETEDPQSDFSDEFSMDTLLDK